MGGTYQLRESNGGVIATFGSKDATHALYLEQTPSGIYANYKTDNKWKTAIAFATKTDLEPKVFTKTGVTTDWGFISWDEISPKVIESVICKIDDYYCAVALVDNLSAYVYYSTTTSGNVIRAINKDYTLTIYYRE